MPPEPDDQGSSPIVEPEGPPTGVVIKHSAEDDDNMVVADGQ